MAGEAATKIRTCVRKKNCTQFSRSTPFPFKLGDEYEKPSKAPTITQDESSGTSKLALVSSHVGGD
jgi:hypothetical protein